MGELAEPDAEVTCGRDQAGHCPLPHPGLTLTHKHLPGAKAILVPVSPHTSTCKAVGVGEGGSAQHCTSRVINTAQPLLLPGFLVGEMHKMPLQSIRITEPILAQNSKTFFFFFVKCKTETWKSASFLVRKKKSASLNTGPRMIFKGF